MTAPILRLERGSVSMKIGTFCLRLAASKVLFLFEMSDGRLDKDSY